VHVGGVGVELPLGARRHAVVTGWFYGVVVPLAGGAARPDWWLVIAQLAMVVLLREVARERWRRAEWPRGQRVA
jgi:hypothetical protein